MRLLPDKATCKACEAALWGYQCGRADERLAVAPASPAAPSRSVQHLVNQWQAAWLSTQDISRDSEADLVRRIEALIFPAALILHCSCGAACTPDEYVAHRAMGHDAPAALRDEAERSVRTYRDRWCEKCGVAHRFFTGWTTAGSKDDQLPNMQTERHSVSETLPQMAAGSAAAPKAECDLAQARDATEENYGSPIAATTPPSTSAHAFKPIDNNPWIL